VLNRLTSPAEVTQVEQALATFYRTQRSSYGLEQIDTDGLSEYVAVIQRYAPHGASVLEFGAGTWWSPLMLHRAGFQVTGCDLFSEADLAAFQERVAGAPRLVSYDGRSIPLPDASVDVVTSRNAFEHIIHVDSMLADLDRVLAPGGIFVLVGRIGAPAQRDSWSGATDARGRSLLALRIDVAGVCGSTARSEMGSRRARGRVASLPPDRAADARWQDRL
jgi:SAM-dependent methyltransferase